MKELAILICLSVLYGLVLGFFKGIKSFERVKLAGWWAAWGILGGMIITGTNFFYALGAGIMFLLSFHFGSYVKKCFFRVYNIPIEDDP